MVGERSEAICFDRYCTEKGIRPTFVMPSATDITSAERLGTCGLSEALVGKFDDVVSFGDDLQVVTDVIRRDMGLPYRDISSLMRTCSKSESRAWTQLNNFLPKSAEIPLKNVENIQNYIADIRFPLIIKPSNAYYSAGVTRCDSEIEVSSAFASAMRVARLMNARRGVSSILVQEYIDGPEFAVDGFIYSNEILPILIHQKYPQLSGPLFHEYAVISKHLLQNDQNDSKLIEFVRAVVMASGLNNSPFHMEFRQRDGNEFVLLEIAPRLSGGGATGYSSAKICAGLDMFELLSQVNNGGLQKQNIRADRSLISLEYDFAATRPGKIMNLDEVQKQCLILGASEIYEFKRNGDYIRKEGEALGSCMLAYFPCVTWEEAEDKFNYIFNNLCVEVI